MFLGFHAPHEPYVMPKRYLNFCKPENAPLPKARAADEYETKSNGYRRRVDFFKKMFGEGSHDKTRRGIAGHHCLLKMVDDLLGQVLDELQKLGLLENTLVVFTSDHGDVLGEHGIFNKAATFYEGEIRIPMMVRFPDGRHAGKRLEHLGSSLDFFPTLMDILGIQADVSLPGRSLMPLIQKGEKVRDHVTTATTNGMMIRTEKEKLWHNRSADDGEMYDLEKDPLELNNLFHKPNYLEMRRRLSEEMLLARMNDDFETSWPTQRDRRLRQEVRSSYEPETG
jgi:arylsulfatase A-like enzyme